MHRLILRFLLAAATAASSSVSVADHINGYFADDSGTRLQLRQQGLNVFGQAVLANGQTVTLNGQSDSGDYVRGQTQGAFNGTFELLYQRGNPGTVRIILYNGNFQAAVDETVFVQTMAPPSTLNDDSDSRKTGSVFGGGGDRTQGDQQPHGQQPYDQTRQQHDNNQQQHEQNNPSGGSSLPDVD